MQRDATQRADGSLPQHGRRGWSRGDTVAVLMVTAVAGALRGWGLGFPPRRIFDEATYARDACTYVNHAKAMCNGNFELSKEHPPLGKWLIAWGTELLGYDPVGWRWVACLAGVLTVSALYVLVRRVLGSTTAAVLAAGLLALDPLHFVLSRVAMLDVFVTLFGTLAMLFAVLDRHATPAGTSRGWWRPWRALCGLCVGAAVATKWAGVLVLLAVAMVLLLAHHARPDRDRSRTRAWWRELASFAVWLGVLPALVYIASYAGRLPYDPSALPWEPGFWPREFLRRQAYMVDFHSSIDVRHPYDSSAWSWLLAKRPVVFFYDTTDAGVREILGISNPLLLVPGVLAACAAGARAALRRVPTSPEVVVAVAALATYSPWLLLTAAAGRPTFIFYILPAVPFLYLALAWAVVIPLRRPDVAVRPGVLAVAPLGVAVAVLAFWHPVLVGARLSPDEWQQRVLFTACADDRPPDVAASRFAPAVRPGPAPSGWCWI